MLGSSAGFHFFDSLFNADEPRILIWIHIVLWPEQKNFALDRDGTYIALMILCKLVTGTLWIKIVSNLVLIPCINYKRYRRKELLIAVETQKPFVNILMFGTNEVAVSFYQ